MHKRDTELVDKLTCIDGQIPQTHLFMRCPTHRHGDACVVNKGDGFSYVSEKYKMHICINASKLQ